jgi:hypothetical protein
LCAHLPHRLAPKTRFDFFRFAGQKGAIELFVAAGRRVDP